MRTLGSCAAAALGLLAASCASTTPKPLEWETISPEQTSLIFADAGGKLTAQRHERADRPGQAVIERSFWSSGAGERARLHLITIISSNPSAFTTANQKSIADEVVAAWQNTNISLGTAGRGDNDHGRYEYLRFVATPSIDCVAVRQYFGGDGIPRQEFTGQPLGKRVLRGWYCAQPGASLTAKRMAAFFGGYSLRSG